MLSLLLNLGKRRMAEDSGRYLHLVVGGWKNSKIVAFIFHSKRLLKLWRVGLSRRGWGSDRMERPEIIIVESRTISWIGKCHLKFKQSILVNKNWQYCWLCSFRQQCILAQGEMQRMFAEFQVWKTVSHIKEYSNQSKLKAAENEQQR